MGEREHPRQGTASTKALRWDYAAAFKEQQEGPYGCSRVSEAGKGRRR